ncbi:MAG: roadblock/LC7 domain-containing protein [Thiothrix litoralis]|jgi:predicted regulator of Ras-like GTPase activity (Roadblock/LC7/MglB family)|uniref:roadblock/LC7 domain-containing protein n=1 Tax=Thiothrix litoralis TaxID=2891210 RepID=UPI003C7934C5
MINSPQTQHFAQQLQHNIPGIKGIQLLTADGMAIHSDTQGNDEDQLSALLALLSSGADRLADHLGESTPSGLIVCIGASAYVITRVGEELLLGLQVPADLGHPQFLQTVCDFIHLARDTPSFRAGRDSASALADPLLAPLFG